MKHLYRNILTGIFTLLIASATYAQLIAYDSFTAVADPTAPGNGQYDDDLVLVGQNPSVNTSFYTDGWNGAWLLGSSTSPGVLGGTNLTYSGVNSTGGSIDSTVNGRAGRILDTVYDNSSSDTVYMSFMMQAITTNNNYRAFELHNGGFNDGANRRLQIGVGENGSSNYAVRLFNNNADGFYGSLGTINTDVNFFVLKFTFSTVNDGDSLDVWFNPTGTELNSETLAGTADFSKGGFNLSFDRTSVANFGSGAVWDELRIGETWQDVSTIPEPASFALVGIALGAVFFFRRRK